MATYIWCELVCGTCSGAFDGQFVSDGRLPRRELVKSAKAQGAIFEGNEVYCSQQCLKQSQQGKEGGE